MDVHVHNPAVRSHTVEVGSFSSHPYAHLSMADKHGNTINFYFGLEGELKDMACELILLAKKLEEAQCQPAE